MLAQWVVDLIESTSFASSDPTQLLAAIAAVLGAAGLVSLREYPVGGRSRLTLLVAEPLPRGQSSVAVELGWPGDTDALLGRLRRFAEHPAVDALVVVGTDARQPRVPRVMAGVPVLTAIARFAPERATT